MQCKIHVKQRKNLWPDAKAFSGGLLQKINEFKSYVTDEAAAVLCEFPIYSSCQCSIRHLRHSTRLRTFIHVRVIVRRQTESF
jgi:hypothetical protein